MGSSGYVLRGQYWKRVNGWDKLAQGGEIISGCLKFKANILV